MQLVREGGGHLCRIGVIEKPQSASLTLFRRLEHLSVESGDEKEMSRWRQRQGAPTSRAEADGGDDRAIGTLIDYLRNTEIGGREDVNDRSMWKEKRTWDNDCSKDSMRVRRPTIMRDYGREEAIRMTK